jgi:SAM-dependent methyltransferase
MDADAATAWSKLSGSTSFQELVGAGRVVQTTTVDPEPARSLVPAGEWDIIVEHERIPFVSYPYEWSFSMLRDAASAHLEILLAVLDDGIGMKDGTAFNMQWIGTAPVFIDIGSFEPLSDGPWAGYRQFCQTFLFPLLLESHLGVPFQHYLRGQLEGFDPVDMRNLLRGTKRFKRGVFRNVYLHSILAGRAAQGTQETKRELSAAGANTTLTKATATKLLKTIRRLRTKRASSNWTRYRETCSYSDEDRQQKERFVRAALEVRPGSVVWDLGCNDGYFARVAAETAEYVVAVDSDDVVIDQLYGTLRQSGTTNILPLVIELVDPSPARGWRGLERKAFDQRGRPDVVLALALVHHLALSANVPLPQIVDWLRSFGGTCVVEFVAREDPMAEVLLGNKPPGTFPDYHVDRFEQLLGEAFTIEQRLPLPSGHRTLFLLSPLT